MYHDTCTHCTDLTTTYEFRCSEQANGGSLLFPVTNTGKVIVDLTPIQRIPSFHDIFLYMNDAASDDAPQNTTQCNAKRRGTRSKDVSAEIQSDRNNVKPFLFI
jgi:hypothetical protein